MYFHSWLELELFRATCDTWTTPIFQPVFYRLGKPKAEAQIMFSQN